MVLSILAPDPENTLTQSFPLLVGRLGKLHYPIPASRNVSKRTAPFSSLNTSRKFFVLA
jgi:hypothetical protein